MTFKLTTRRLKLKLNPRIRLLQFLFFRQESNLKTSCDRGITEIDQYDEFLEIRG